MRAGFLGRRVIPQPDRHVVLELDRIPMDHLQLPLAGFGNVTAGDARRVEEALMGVAARLPRPELFFAGAELVDTVYGRTVAAKVDGDVELLSTIAREMTHSVERLGFYVDRRRFHPWVEVARATQSTTRADLDAAAAALWAFVGQPWEVDGVRIFTTLLGGSGSEFRQVESIPLGGQLTR